MKLALLTLGLCAVVLAKQRWASPLESQRGSISESHYRPEREYRYLYNGQVSSGLPQGSQQHASTRVQALVSIVFKNEKSALLKLKDIRFGSLNREVENPREVLPFGVFEESTIEEQHLKALRLPLRFKYESGLVSEIEFDTEDNHWSANIKRAVLNMLQINTKKQGRTDISEESRLWKLDESREETHDFFTVQEPTMEGDCETSYTINKLPTESRNVFNISKSINFEKCRERADIRYNLRFAEQCENCEPKFNKDERNTQSTTVMHFNVSGTPEKFMIENVEVKSLYVFAPFNSHENVLSTYVSSRLELIHADKIENRVEEPKSEKKESLLYSVEWDALKERFHMSGDDEFLRDTKYNEIKDKSEIVDKIITRMVRAMSDEKLGVDADVTRQMARLVDILRMCGSEDIKKIHREIFESKKFEEEKLQKVRDIMVDALAIAGTKHTIDHLIEKITDRKVSMLKASMALKTLINIRTVSEEHIEAVLRLCKHEVSENSPMLKQSCWLTAGAMINGLCKENEDKLAVEIIQTRSQKTLCPRTLKEKYVEELIRLFRQASTRYEKVLALKTLANAGLDLSVFEVEKIIVDQREEKLVRMQAIDSLRQLRTVMPRKIQKILMPILKNRFEYPEIRMTAFHHIMQTQPERALLDQISQMLYNERSHQVHSFVLSTMRTFANSSIPCEKRLAEDLQVSLRHARNQPENWADSKYIHLPIYSENYKSGASIDFAAIFSNDSVLPKEVMASLDSVFAGQWSKHSAQFGLIQQNVEQLLAKLIKIVSEGKTEELITRGRRSTSSFLPTEILRDLFSKLSIRSRRQNEEPQAMLYLRYKNFDYALLPMDEESIPKSVKSMIRDGKLDLSEIERFLSQGHTFNTNLASFIYESSRKIATSIGMPLMVSSKIPTVASIKGHIKVELEPKSSKSITGAKLRVMLYPAIASTHVTKMEIWTPIVNTGVKVALNGQVHLPLDVTLDVNAEKKIVVKTIVKLPESIKRIVGLQTRPSTYVRTWPRDSKTYVEPKEKTIYGEEMDEHLVTYEKSYGEKSLGVNFRVSGQWHRSPVQMIKGMPLPLLAGENFVEITMEKGEQSPREVMITLEADTFEKVSKIEKPDFENFFTGSSPRMNERDLFETEDAENFEESESERRTHFNKYAKNYKSENGYKHRMSVKVEAVGPVERKASMDLVTVCDEKIRFCQWNIDARRSPVVGSEESREWTLESEIQTLYPEVAETLKELKEQKHREFHAKIESKWGSEKKSYINIKIQGEQNREQKKWISRINDQSEKSPVDMYEKMISIAQLNQYKLSAEYEVSPVVENITSKAYNFLKYSTFWNSESQILSRRESSKMISAMLTIDPRTRQYVNLTIETPVERLQLTEVLLPVRIQPLNIRRDTRIPRTIRDVIQDTVYEKNAECRIQSRRVETFDDVVFKAPLTTCYSVLAKDCSSEKEPRFAVLMKKVQADSEDKKMKIISKDSIIELKKVDEEIEIKINGKVVRDEDRLREENIVKQSKQMYKIHLEEEGVTVTFDGLTAVVKVSSFYRNGQCGLCGHYDGEKEDELRMADNKLTEDLEQFHRSFLHQDEECEMEESKLSERKNYRMIESEEESRSSEEEREPEERDEERKNSSSEEDDEEKTEKKPVLRTKVIEHNHELCFSTKAVPVCPKNTFDKESTEKSVQFACVPRSSSEARQLARQARTQVVNVDSFKLSYAETVVIPSLCLAY